MSSSGSRRPRRAAFTVRRAIPSACDSARRARTAARRSPRRRRDSARSRAVWRRRRPAFGSRKYASSAPSDIPKMALAAIAGGLTAGERPRLKRLRLAVTLLSIKGTSWSVWGTYALGGDRQPGYAAVGCACDAREGERGGDETEPRDGDGRRLGGVLRRG